MTSDVSASCRRRSAQVSCFLGALKAGLYLFVYSFFHPACKRCISAFDHAPILSLNDASIISERKTERNGVCKATNSTRSVLGHGARIVAAPGRLKHSSNTTQRTHCRSIFGVVANVNRHLKISHTLYESGFRAIKQPPPSRSNEQPLTERVKARVLRESPVLRTTEWRVAAAQICPVSK